MGDKPMSEEDLCWRVKRNVTEIRNVKPRTPSEEDIQLLVATIQLGELQAPDFVPQEKRVSDHERIDRCVRFLMWSVARSKD